MAEQDGWGDSTENKGTRVGLTEFQPRGLWLHWILATMLGATGGGAAFQALRQRKSYLVWMVGLAVFAVVIGIAQSLVLERGSPKSDRSAQIRIRWVLACLIGWIAGGMAGFIAPVGVSLLLMFFANVDYTWIYHHGYSLHWLSLVSAGILFVSLAQQYVLQTRFRLVERWMWVSIVGWSAGWVVGLAMAHIMPGSEIVKGAVGGASGGAVLGSVTGRALVDLLTDFHLHTEP